MIHPITFLKGIGFGAGLMYLFDPDRGNQRRAQLRDQFGSAMHSCESCVETAVRDMQNRWQGLTHDASRLMTTQPADDRTVAERVRSTMGRYVSHPRAIDVDVQEGCVCLSGAILADEVQPFVRAVRGVPGVQQVENQLEVHHSPSGVSALQGGHPRRKPQFELMQENWSPATRLLMSGVGAGLVANCLVRRSPMAMILGTVGFGLLARSTSNEPVGRLVGLESTAARGSRSSQPAQSAAFTQAAERRGDAQRETEPSLAEQCSNPESESPAETGKPSIGQASASPPT